MVVVGFQNKIWSNQDLHLIFVNIQVILIFSSILMFSSPNYPLVRLLYSYNVYFRDCYILNCLLDPRLIVMGKILSEFCRIKKKKQVESVTYIFD